MLKHYYLVLISTLLIGFCSGAYVYFITRVPDSPKPVEEVPRDGFEVVANQYGGCERRGCSVYRIENDGAYTFIAYDSENQPDRFQDIITETQQSNLKTLLNDTDFASLKEELFTGTCPAEFDGIGYRYEIRYEGDAYSFDSCEEDVEGEPLFLELKNYFDIFRLIHGVL